MFIITRAIGTPQDVERRESSYMFCETFPDVRANQVEIKAWESGHNKTQTADCTPCRPRFVRWRISTFSALGTLAN